MKLRILKETVQLQKRYSNEDCLIFQNFSVNTSSLNLSKQFSNRISVIDGLQLEDKDSKEICSLVKENSAPPDNINVL